MINLCQKLTVYPVPFIPLGLHCELLILVCLLLCYELMTEVMKCVNVYYMLIVNEHLSPSVL